MKIAIQLNSDRNIIGIYSSPESGAEQQSKIEGWTLVDSDPAFLITESYLWTVREEDNKLVYISDNRTSDERNQANITALTQDGLATKMTTVQLQTAVTQLTKSNLQLTLDNATLKTDRDQLKSDSSTQQQAITQLTTELMSMKLSTEQKSTSSTDASETGK